MKSPGAPLRAKLKLRSLAMRLLAKTVPAQRAPGTSRAALICPPAAPGSMGDAAMVIALRDRLRAAGFSKIGIIDYNRGKSWLSTLEFDAAVRMPESSLLRWRHFARQLQEYDRVYVIGADCLDGYYSPSLSRRLLEVGSFAALVGCRATICGSSFNVSPSPEVLATLGVLPAGLRLLARDPLSLSRMIQHASVRPELVADLAFLLQPDLGKIRIAARWIEQQRAVPRRILGVNIANAFLGAARKDETPLLVTRFTEALRHQLARHPELAVILLPHDVRGERSDRALCEQVHRTLTAEFPDRLHLFAESDDPRALKAAAGLLDACVTCRMHFGIACLGSGTPIGVIPYQDKFEGLFQHFMITPPVLLPEIFFTPGKLEEFMGLTLSAAGTLAPQIANRKGKVAELSFENLDLDTPPASAS